MRCRKRSWIGSCFSFMSIIPNLAEERRIARETTGAPPAPLAKLITGEQVMHFQEVVQRVPVPDHIYDTAT